MVKKNGFKQLKGILQNLNNQIITQLSEAAKETIQERVNNSVDKALKYE